MSTLLLILALVAVAYLAFGLGVAVTMLHTHYARNNMGGPPDIYYLLALVMPFTILADQRRAGRIRRNEDIR